MGEEGKKKAGGEGGAERSRKPWEEKKRSDSRCVKGLGGSGGPEKSMGGEIGVLFWCRL